MTAPRGRALQMNAGAAMACGDILLFLHADTLLPQKAFPKIITALSNSSFIGGAFESKNTKQPMDIQGYWSSCILEAPPDTCTLRRQADFLLRRHFENIGAMRRFP